MTEPARQRFPRVRESNLTDFNLTRYFVVISACVILLAAVGVAAIFNHLAHQQAVEESQDDAVALTLHIEKEIGPMLIALLADPEAEAIRDQLESQLVWYHDQWDVALARLYDPHGRPIFSDADASLDFSLADSAGLEKALAGQTWSEFEASDEIAQTHITQPLPAYLVETYLPVHSADGRQIIGVLEIYRDVTADHERAGRIQNTTVVVVALAMGGLFAALSLIVRRGDRLLAETNLLYHKVVEAYSEKLAEMVEERTQELREAQGQLVRREKLAALGQLAGGVAHELRNPLGAIKSAAYFLNMVLEEPEPEVKTTLEILEKEVTTSERIISSLLDFARPKPPIRRKVDVNGLVREALSRTTVPENVEVMSQLDETLPAVLADPDQLAQVFGNLILNAIQAMTLPSRVGTPEGGRLVVRTWDDTGTWRHGDRETRRQGDTGTGRHGDTETRGQGDSLPLSPSPCLRVSVSDTGVGIPEEHLGKLFEPLFTTKAKGIGLGLALVKTLVEEHGGTVEVQSEVEKGSTFTVRLPVSGGEKK